MARNHRLLIQQHASRNNAALNLASALPQLQLQPADNCVVVTCGTAPVLCICRRLCGGARATALFLVYTAIVTPPMIAFHWLDEDCVGIPTLPIDTALDCFFILDILVNFNLAVIKGGEIEDDRATITKEYLKGGFLFDLCNSFPVSFFELYAQSMCDKLTPEEIASGQSSGLCACSRTSTRTLAKERDAFA